MVAHNFTLTVKIPLTYDYAMILVTGATGTIGCLIIRELTARSMAFRALVRSADQGRELACAYVVGSFEDHESLVRAFLGTDRLVLNGPVGAQMAAQQMTVIAAAVGANVPYVVKISSAGADLRSDREVNRQHALIEQRLADSPIASTSLRPTYFMQNFFGSAASISGSGHHLRSLWPGPIGLHRLRGYCGLCRRTPRRREPSRGRLHADRSQSSELRRGSRCFRQRPG